MKDRIFASALHHFSLKGFAASSLREISADAQTTKPMIYYYFGSKEGLYESIVRQILGEMAVALEDLPAEATACNRVLSYCQRYVDYFLANEDVIALVLREVFGLGGAPMAAFAQTLGERVRQPLDAVLRHGMESGELVRDHVFPCSTAITGILNIFILAHVFGGAAIDRTAPLIQVHRYLAGLVAQP
ncbi:MAG: TetR/AcrR family transcriptional regulator [Dehalococcoidia bacterium]|nr:TetR/AcrR family transcriptional regulator [Dehalococcoidia bacterium]